MSTISSKSQVVLSSVPRGWVTLAALGLLVAALVGVALGVNRSLGAPDTPADTGELAPVPNTTLAKALPADSVFDEARIRSIAREEAQAALARSAPRPKPVPKPDAESDAADASADGATPVVAPKITSITPVRPTVTTSVRPSAPSSRPPATTNPYPPGLSPN